MIHTLIDINHLINIVLLEVIQLGMIKQQKLKDKDKRNKMNNGKEKLKEKNKNLH